MCCDNTIRMMNDFLDKTLSKDEEQRIKSHLGECESCRREYQNLEKADNALRQVICGMVADIEVPRNLSERIELTLSAGNRETTLWSRLSVLFKTPAAAAAMLFVVLLSGFLTYNNYNNPASNQHNVALSDKDTGIYTDGTGSTAEDKNGAAAEKTAPAKEVRVLQAESDLVGNSDVILRDAPENTVSDTAMKQPESAAGLLRAMPPAPASDTAPDELSKSQPADVQRSAYITAAPLGMGGGAPASNRGTMEEAAVNVGFIPAKPGYLPQGATLSDVSWLSDETSQNYRAGRNYFTVSQNRLDAADFEYIESYSKGSAVDVNGLQGFIQVSGPEPGDTGSGTVTTVRWRQGDWAFKVSGDLPAEEIIRISVSIK